MTRRRPSNRSRILGSGFRPHIGNRCRFPKHLAHRLRAGRWSSGFLPADTLDASRSDADMKSWADDGNNRVVCHEPEGTADRPGRARPSATRPQPQPAERLRRLQLPDRPLHINRLRRCNPESVGAQTAASFLFFFPNRRGVPSFRSGIWRLGPGNSPSGSTESRPTRFGVASRGSACFKLETEILKPS